LLLLVCAPAPRAAQSTAAPSFTRAQADQGRDVYAARCASCHGGQLTDGNAPPLSGEAFGAKWSSAGRSLDELFMLIRTTMPFGAEGSLSEGEYLAVMAHLLERNGRSAGADALTADRAVLANARLMDASPTPATPAGWNVRTIVPDF
jgi:mono/diheme cytochrome c family protein